ncbi:hypothetical protein HYN59_16910 [Flavobacterium album]|uniref:Uncharacterized protein n=1 Tax=Flavobacterium album TaxID=2175091 RepID=A0A2S1R2C9_9FLAO|nr:hypothetical protein HYN59_16910 [Flavobacterium album]
MFKGFDNSEFDSIVVQEYNNAVLLDSFKMHVRPAENPLDVENKMRSGSTDRFFNVNYQYHFLIPGQKPFILANMKMVMWSQFTMFSEGYGCVMGDYTIDGIHFEHDGNPTFKKR